MFFVLTDFSSRFFFVQIVPLNRRDPTSSQRTKLSLYFEDLDKVEATFKKGKWAFQEGVDGYLGPPCTADPVHHLRKVVKMTEEDIMVDTTRMALTEGKLKERCVEVS